MAGTTNFIQWDPTATNQETDAAYVADAQRSGGAVTGQFPSATANKLFYQLSTFTTAFAQMMANKGYSTSDANLAALVAVLSNVLTNADLGGFAISLSANGYLKLPTLLGGIMIQWANLPNAHYNMTTMTFPTPFPNACFVVIPTDGGQSSVTPVPAGASPLSKTQYMLTTSSGATVSWIAIGY